MKDRTMNADFDYKVDLRLKNVLIIMPNFFGYQAKIKDDLIARGANPHFYNEEPDKTRFLILKNLENLFKKKDAFKSFNKNLCNQIIAEMPAGGYDYLLVIRGNVLSTDTISVLKERVLKSEAKTVYYAWDSFKNMRHKGELGRCFDRRATFDSVDASENSDYDLLPLFYSDDFDANRLEKVTEYKYDYVSVSSFFPFRYRYFKAFKAANPDKKLMLKLYLSPSVYRGKKLKDPKLVRDLDMDIVSFTPFSAEEIRDMCLNSKAILDLATENQPGLTMRTMETLGLKRKLVTNNSYIRDYAFYNENNITILEDLAAKADEAEATGDYTAFKLPDEKWLDKSYEGNEPVRSQYSVHAWIDNLFG